MDQPGTEREALMAELQKRLSEFCKIFRCWTVRKVKPQECWETIAMADEELLSGIWKAERLQMMRYAG